MGQVARRRREAREARLRATLTLLAAGGKLQVMERDGLLWVHIPEAYRHSTAATAAYLFSCLPEQATATGGDR
jgi:hypothetical protein